MLRLGGSVLLRRDAARGLGELVAEAIVLLLLLLSLLLERVCLWGGTDFSEARESESVSASTQGDSSTSAAHLPISVRYFFSMSASLPLVLAYDKQRSEMMHVSYCALD